MSAGTGPESFRATWHKEAERLLDRLAGLIEYNADQEWEAKAHGEVCAAWRLFKDNMEVRAAGDPE